MSPAAPSFVVTPPAGTYNVVIFATAGSAIGPASVHDRHRWWRRRIAHAMRAAAAATVRPRRRGWSSRSAGRQWRAPYRVELAGRPAAPSWCPPSARSRRPTGRRTLHRHLLRPRRGGSTCGISPSAEVSFAVGTPAPPGTPPPAGSGPRTPDPIAGQPGSPSTVAIAAAASVVWRCGRSARRRVPR
jgi:hypothetical protein